MPPYSTPTPQFTKPPLHYPHSNPQPQTPPPPPPPTQTNSSFTYSYPSINLYYPNLKLLTKQETECPIYSVDNFLDDSDCDYLISQTKSHFTSKINKEGPLPPSSVVNDNDASKSSVVSPVRTSSTTHISPNFIPSIIQKLSALLPPPLHAQTPLTSNYETPQISFYTKQQYYMKHFDAFDVNTNVGSNLIRQSGNRIYTCLLYLNDMKDCNGGATFFEHATPCDSATPCSGLRVNPKRGKLVIFFPCKYQHKIESMNDTFTDCILDSAALHSAEPVVGDESVKFVMQIWVRERGVDGVGEMVLDRIV